MKKEFFLTAHVLVLFTACTYCESPEGVPVMFPTDLKSFNFRKSQSQSPYYLSASLNSQSEDPSHSQSDVSFDSPPPGSVASKVRKAYSSTRNNYPPENGNYYPSNSLLGNPFNSQSDIGFEGKPPGSVASKAKKAYSSTRHNNPTRNGNIYPYSISSERRSVDLSELDEQNSEENNINSVEKIFAQRSTPPCAKESSLSGICEDDSEYNNEVEERFELALNKMNMSETFYQSILFKLIVDTPTEVTSRFGGNDILEDPVCPATEKFIFPKRGMNRNNEWVFLLNQGNVKQAIKVEECLNTSRLSRLRSSRNGDLTCGLMTDTGVESVCRQKFILKNMIAMDSSGSNVVTEAILIPSCCVCLQKISASRVGNRYGLEFDEEGNLITEPPNQSRNINAQQNPPIIPSDDEHSNFALPQM